MYEIPLHPTIISINAKVIPRVVLDSGLIAVEHHGYVLGRLAVCMKLWGDSEMLRLMITKVIRPLFNTTPSMTFALMLLTRRPLSISKSSVSGVIPEGRLLHIDMQDMVDGKSWRPIFF